PIIDPLVDPGNVNPPAVFEPQSTFTNGKAQLWIAASGGANWGGANVFVSFDGVTYNFVGPIINPARQGVLSAPLAAHSDPHTVDTLSVDLTQSFGTFSGDSTMADADANRTLSLITDAFSTSIPCVGELLSYGTSTLTSNYHYDLTYLRRGQIGTAHAAWASGSFFPRIDLANAAGDLSPTLLIYDLPVAYIGATVYLKFCSFNVFGGQQQDIADVVVYSYVPCGGGYGTGPGGVPATPTGLTATGEIGGVALSRGAHTPTRHFPGFQPYTGGRPRRKFAHGH